MLRGFRRQDQILEKMENKNLISLEEISHKRHEHSTSIVEKKTNYKGKLFLPSEFCSMKVRTG